MKKKIEHEIQHQLFSKLLKTSDGYCKGLQGGLMTEVEVCGFQIKNLDLLSSFILKTMTRIAILPIKQKKSSTCFNLQQALLLCPLPMLHCQSAQSEVVVYRISLVGIYSHLDSCGTRIRWTIESYSCSTIKLVTFTRLYFYKSFQLCYQLSSELQRSLITPYLNLIISDNTTKCYNGIIYAYYMYTLCLYIYRLSTSRKINPLNKSNHFVVNEQHVLYYFYHSPGPPVMQQFPSLPFQCTW